jgi:hypothetical protein
MYMQFRNNSGRLPYIIHINCTIQVASNAVVINEFDKLGGTCVHSFALRSIVIMLNQRTDVPLL